MVAPGHATVLPLPPEFITTRDGSIKQDCEHKAAYRWLDRIGPRLTGLKPVYLGDALYACHPMAVKVRQVGADFLFTAKPGNLKTLYRHLGGAQTRSYATSRGRGAKHRLLHYRWVDNLPLRDDPCDGRVNWLQLTITNPRTNRSTRFAWVTSLPINAGNVVDMADCARARWKIENETFNTLKNFGTHLEHNFGHGNETLSMVLVVLNLLAFMMHAICDISVEMWQRAREGAGTRKRMFAALATLTHYVVYDSWHALIGHMAGERPP